MRQIKIEDGSRDDYLDQMLVNAQLVTELEEKESQIQKMQSQIFCCQEEISWLKETIRDLGA